MTCIMLQTFSDSTFGWDKGVRCKTERFTKSEKNVDAISFLKWFISMCLPAHLEVRLSYLVCQSNLDFQEFTEFD